MKRIRLLVFLFALFVLPSFGQISTNDSAEIKNIVSQWSDALNAKDTSKLADLYSSQVLYYTKGLSNESCIAKAAELFNLHYSFSQKIVSPIQFTEFTTGVIKCDFTREVNTSGKVEKLPSYLLIKKEGDNYLITGESDTITDYNLKYHLQIGDEVVSTTTDNVPTEDKKPVSLIFIVSCIIGVVFLFGLIFYFVVKSKSKQNNADANSQIK